MTQQSRNRRRDFFYVAQRGACCHCGEEMRLEGNPMGRFSASWEHLKPKSDGGSTMWNTLLAHRQCNNERKSDPLANFEELQAKARRIWAAWLSMPSGFGKRRRLALARMLADSTTQPAAARAA